LDNRATKARPWQDAINKEQTFCRKNALLWATRKKVCSLYRVSDVGLGWPYPVSERRSGRFRASSRACYASGSVLISSYDDSF
jgi:hypothetical protein